MKHSARLIIVILSLVLISSALAQGNAPASQFGFRGWPYRQGTGGCPAGCGQCDSDQDCACCAYCQGVFCTARPADTASPQPSAPANPSPVPPRPVQTAAPFPSLKPTETPAIRPTARPADSPSISTGDYTTFSVTAQEQKVLDLLNQDRQANGLPRLTLDPELSRLARLKCEDMRDQRYFAHESPTWGSAAAMLTRFGYAFQGVGENIAHHATVEKAQAAFMSSSGHRANLLGRQWTKVGVGVCLDSQGFVYVTQLFVR